MLVLFCGCVRGSMQRTVLPGPDLYLSIYAVQEEGQTRYVGEEGVPGCCWGKPSVYVAGSV